LNYISDPQTKILCDLILLGISKKNPVFNNRSRLVYLNPPRIISFHLTQPFQNKSWRNVWDPIVIKHDYKTTHLCLIESLNITSNQDIYKRNNQNQNSDAFLDSKTQTIGCYWGFIEGSKIRKPMKIKF